METRFSFGIKVQIITVNEDENFKEVNKKSLPASEKLINFEIDLSIKLNKGLPIGVFNIDNAKNH